MIPRKDNLKKRPNYKDQIMLFFYNTIPRYFNQVCAKDIIIKSYKLNRHDRRAISNIMDFYLKRGG